MEKARLTQLKARLTIAKRKGCDAVVAECRAVLAEFETTGDYPDCWKDWERAKTDADITLWYSRKPKGSYFGD